MFSLSFKEIIRITIIVYIDIVLSKILSHAETKNELESHTETRDLSHTETRKLTVLCKNSSWRMKLNFGSVSNKITVIIDCGGELFGENHDYSVRYHI